MATQYQNLSSYNPEFVPDGAAMRIGIVTAEWNIDVTGAMLQGAIDALVKHGVKEENILSSFVPGTFELTYGAKAMLDRQSVDAVIVLGCVVRGGTPHFDYVCQGVTYGIAKLNATGEVPVIFGVLTTDDMQQAIDRSGGVHGNKGVEAAITALKMAQFLK
jgi:6,7-dimethyl-8-ribityllumazine synthase